MYFNIDMKYQDKFIAYIPKFYIYTYKKHLKGVGFFLICQSLALLNNIILIMVHVCQQEFMPVCL